MIANVVSFNRKASLIVVPVTIKTQTGIQTCKFAVDTEAKQSLTKILNEHGIY